MTRIILSGCNGKMGRVITSIVRERKDCVIVAGFDINFELKQEYPVYMEPESFDGNADVIIDFSHPAFFGRLLAFARARGIPAVIATTGLSEEQLASLREASGEVAVFNSANMSLGVNLICELARRAAAVLSDRFDVEIVEMHHNQKIDAPSGTALMIADAVSKGMTQQPQLVYDRHDERKKREKNEIGIHSVRGGTIVGEHEVIFAGQDEVIRISHSAMSKQIFANGAVNAALFLSGRQPGLYSMNDLLSFTGGCK
ncbi:MAG: 4-hydroxy-tetrahydrodipicolinate reductase [Clostridia bacterium]|nr:4-hydroxy-tetrahydrodipicolinate reductase [Clostridia bacterium]MDR3644265.1 4-hydroxy-tetrahydrodipicolinate reductase [Clostridia bacterium]